jgi:hypothetical protein
MKKNTKTLLATCLALVLLFTGMPITALAASNDVKASISPRLSHLSDVKFTFSATSSGGHTNVSYMGYSDSFAKADIHVKLQKRFLLILWTDVDEWSVSSTNYENDLSHCFTLDGTGTYKATLTFTATGTDGTVDTYTKEIESKYSK